MASILEPKRRLIGEVCGDLSDPFATDLGEEKVSMRERRPALAAEQSLRAAGPSLKAFLNATRRQARLAAVVGKIPSLKAIASELFLGTIEMDIEEDPELPHRKCLVVSVETNANLAEVAKLRREWYNHVCGLLGQESDLVQINVTVR